MISKIVNFLSKHAEKLIFIFLCIWCFTPTIVLVMSKISVSFKSVIWYSLMSTMGIFLLILSLVQMLEKKDFKKFIWIFIFLLWAFICSLMGNDIKLSLYGSEYRGEGLITYFLYGGYFMGAFYLNKKEVIFNLMKVLSVSAVIFSFLQSIFIQPEGESIFYQFNHFGYYLMFSCIVSVFCFLIEKKMKKGLFFLFYLYLLYQLIINNTFGSYLALFITLILYLGYSIFIHKKIWSILILILSFLILSFSVKDNEGKSIEEKNFTVLKKDVVAVTTQKDETAVLNAGTNRGLLWKKGIEFIIKEPIFGYGIEGAEREYYKENIMMDRPHNIVLQMALFTGIPGMLLYIGFVLSLFIRNLWKIKKLGEIEISVCFIAGCYFISSMFGNSMYYTTPYFLIFLGFVMQNIYQRKKIR